jgi:parvulin-like peptidyl-prolyl isomerase
MNDVPFEGSPQSGAPAPIQTSAPSPGPSVEQTTVSKKKLLVTWIVVGVVAVIVLVLLYYFRGVFIAATLNGQPISRLAVVQALERQLGAQVLDSLINQALIETKAEEADITISAEEIETELNTIREQLSSQGTTLEDALTTQGMTMNQLEDDIRTQKLARRLVEEKLRVTDEEVSTYMQENKDYLPPVETEDEQRDIIRNMLEQQKFSSVFQEWLDATRAEANISYWKEY